MKIVIVGAGPTGLGAAWRLHQLDHPDWELWEQAPVVGGLSRSVTDEHGFTWDLGGHVQFSHYGTFDRVMHQALGPDGWLHHERESWVRICGTWVPYPFQYNIHRLPPQQMLRCLQGLLRVARQGRPADRFEHFEHLIRGCLGDGIAELFMLPYNEKTWAWPPAELDTGWIGERVALPDLERVVESIVFDKDHLAWGPNHTFQFPKHGGTGGIWRAVARALPQERLHLERRVTSIDPQRRRVTDDRGRQAPYDALLSSMPLTELTRMAGLDGLARTAARLRHSSVHVVGLGLKGAPGPALRRKCWIYFPEEDCPFYRVTVFSNYSPHNVPDAQAYWSLMAEVSQSPVRPVDASTLAEAVIQGALNTGLIDRRQQVHHTWHRKIEHGYPTPALGRDDLLREVLPALEQLNIYSRGRFGAWRYEVANQDHSFMQGVEAVNRLVVGAPELTLWFPEVVNRPHPAYGPRWL